MISHELIIQSNADGSYSLYKGINFKGYVVEKGFTYDMASIPKILQPLIAKDDLHFRRATAFHDMGYRYQIGKRDADRLLYDSAKEDGAPFWKLSFVMSGLKIGGWVAYRRHTKDHNARIQGFHAYSWAEQYASNPYHVGSRERAWWNWGWMNKRDNREALDIVGVIPMYPSHNNMIR